MRGSKPAGKARKPAASTAGPKEAAQAHATSCPAAPVARAIGTSGWKCPDSASVVNKMRSARLPWISHLYHVGVKQI